MAQDHEPTKGADELETLVAEALAARSATGDDGVDDLCARHPTLAARIRERLARLASTRPSSHAEAVAAFELPGYRAVKVLGEGGMGTVLLAEQHEPVRRQVAIKVIRAGLVGKQVLARFELERQALAVMSHPAIAKVHDAGITADGRPWFVMELVEGEPLHDYCRRSRLSLRDRLEVFQQICHGVEHAHQKGILHRDLKPTNILVARKGEQHLAKIIDFGLARAIEQQPTAPTLQTELGQLLGTPEYMSPEQADNSLQAIDTRTDIYSLGVVLYELLTGELPFDSQRLREGGYHELRRVLREVEPATPSQRVSSGSATANGVARELGLSAPALRSSLRGDLDWIVMRAMAKEPARRYATASALAADVARHLAGEPVDAGPPTARYRLGKLLRRHRVPFAAAALLLVVIVLGAFGMTWFGLEARAERDAKAAALRTARATGLAMASLVEARRDPMCGLLLARAATHVEARTDTVRLLREALVECRERALLAGHEANVTYVGFSPGGEHVVTCSDDGTARVWTRDGTLLATLRGRSEFTQARFSGGGDRVLLTSRFGPAELCAPDGRVLATFAHGKGSCDFAICTPDGARVLTATSGPKTQLKLWSDAGEQLTTFLLDGHLVSVAFAPDNERLLTTDSTPQATLWDIQGNRLADFVGHRDDPGLLAKFGSGYVHGLPNDEARFASYMRAVFSPHGDRVLTTSSDDTARLWDLEGRELAVLQGHRSRVVAATFAPDGQHILTVSWDKTARLWDGNGQPLAVLEWTNDDPYPTTARDMAVFTPDGRFVIGTTTDGMVRVWNLAGERLAAYRIDSPLGAWNTVESPPLVAPATLDWIRLCPTGDRFIALFDDRPRLMRLDGRVLSTLGGHLGVVTAAAFSPTGDQVATASTDGTARIWDTRPQTEELYTTGDLAAPQLVRTITLSRDARLVLTTHSDFVARLCDARGNQLASIPDAATAMLSPQGDRVLTHRTHVSAHGMQSIAGPNEAVVHDLRGEVLLRLEGHRDVLTSAAFSPSGARLLTGSADGTARLWSSDGRLLGTLDGHAQSVTATVFAPDEQHLLTGSGDGKTHLWHAAGAELATLQGNVGAPGPDAFSPDGRTFLTRWGHRTPQQTEGWCTCWNLDGGQVAELRGHTGLLRTARFAPDGATILTAAEDKTARLWDRAGTQLRAFGPHADRVDDAVFTPDGRLVLTSSAGGATLWNLDGEVVAAVPGHRPPAIVDGWPAAMSPTGEQFVTVDREQRLQWWPVRDAMVFQQADRRATRALTADERARYRDLLDDR